MSTDRGRLRHGGTSATPAEDIELLVNALAVKPKHSQHAGENVVMVEVLGRGSFEARLVQP